MNQFLLGILIGIGCSFIVLPVGMWVFMLIRDTLERRKIKRMLKEGKFLLPIDKRDYDTTIWDKLIDAKKGEVKLGHLSEDIFKKKDVTTEEKVE